MLKPSESFLFTRQRHEADRMGLHWDYRLVHGDKAYSFSTKKEMPEPGKMILLFEQPVHDRHYALSKKVVIPKGQYGAGTTYLDFVRKAKIAEGSTSDKLVIHAENGDRFLLKKMPADNKYNKKAWLFRNLGKDTEQEKQASFLASAVGAHIVQNALTNTAISSPTVAQQLANSFSQGVHGVVDTRKRTSLTRGIVGTLAPDIAIAHQSANQAGQALRPVIQRASKRQLVGLRALSEGRFDKIRKYKLDQDPVLRMGYKAMQTHVPLPDWNEAVSKGADLQKIWKDKNNPLLSNIMTRMSRGKVPKGTHFKPGRMSSKPIVAGGSLLTTVDPTAGVLDVIKGVGSSRRVGATKIGRKVQQMLHKTFITSPAKAGLLDPTYNPKSIKARAFQFLGNPMSHHLKRTASAVARAIRK